MKSKEKNKNIVLKNDIEIKKINKNYQILGNSNKEIVENNENIENK